MRFPKAAHDDCLDTTAYQNQVASPPSAGVGDLVSIEDMEGCLSREVNEQQGAYLIGVSTTLPVHYVVGNKQGVFYNAVTGDPGKDIGKHLRDWDKCYVFADQLGDVLWLKELQERYKGKVYVCYLKTDPKSQGIMGNQRPSRVHKKYSFLSGSIRKVRWRGGCICKAG